jgi:hypothetical protein
MKLKGRRFETVSNIQRGISSGNSTALRKIISTLFLKRGKNDGIAVYFPKETILKEMAAKFKVTDNLKRSWRRQICNRSCIN